MDGFTLDTSGGVGLPISRIKRNTLWSDLSPFEQGYVEALFASLSVDLLAGFFDHVDPYRSPVFSDLAPETLAAIRKDCADYQERAAKSEADVLAYSGASNAAKVRHAWLGGGGAQFWVQRNTTDNLRAFFPPLTPYLAEDGNVYLREQA